MTFQFPNFKTVIPVLSYGRMPFMIIVVGRIGVAIASLVAVRVSTTYLHPTQLGSLTELNSLLYLINLVFIAPLGHFINRGFLEWNDSGNLLKHIKRYFTYLILIAIFSFFFSCLLQWMFHLISGFSIFGVGILIGLLTFLQPVYNLSVSGLNLFNERLTFAIFSNLLPWFTLFFSLVAFTFFQNIFAWTSGQIFSLIIGCTSFYFLLKKININNLTPISDYPNGFQYTNKAIFNFSWPIVVTSALWWMQSNSYRFILDKIQDTATVGLFATAYGLAATPVAMYESIISQYLDPVFFNDLKNQDKVGQVNAWNNYAKLYLPGLVFTGIFIAFSTPFLARVLLGNNSYRLVAMKITAWAAIIETMRAIGSLMFHLGIAKTDNRMTIIPVAAGAILAPLCVYILGKWDALYGTIAGLLIASTAVLIIIIFLSRKVLPITWPVKRVAKVVVTTLPLVVGLVTMNHFFPTPDFLLSVMVLLVSGSYAALVLIFLLIKRN